MSESEDRVQDALAAYLEQIEVGGPPPDTTYLSPLEQERLQQLIALLDQTEGIALGRGRDEHTDSLVASTEPGARLIAILRETLPTSTRISTDPSAISLAMSDIQVSEGWIIGTFGGRVRMWLLASETTLEQREESLRGLNRIFRMLPDTNAIALVDSHLSCLLVVPEDCAPNIEVPGGALLARHYRRPIQPVDQALSVYLREVIPPWEPMESWHKGARIAVEVVPLAEDQAKRAIDDQISAGTRARKANPKRKALMELGAKQADDLAKVLIDVYEGRLNADDLENNIRRLAARP